jgi:hypothetical protein
MSGGLDKVEAGVHSIVDELSTIDSVLLLEVGIKARLDIVDDWLPAVGKSQSVREEDAERAGGKDAPVIVVYKVTKPRRVNYSQT